MDSTVGFKGSANPRLMRPMVRMAMWATIETVMPVRIGVNYWSAGCVIRPILENPPDESSPMTRITAP